MAIVKVNDIEYFLEDRLKDNLDNIIIPDLHKKDKDCFLVVDGKEGSGKSFFSFQIGKYVDNSLDLSRVCFTADEFRQAIFKAKRGQCVIYDEAFTGLSSRASLSMINKVLISLTMQMRQKNLFVIIVLPTFFLLDKYIALFRARALVHIFENHGRRGYFRVYNAKLKRLLYLEGYKTYSYFIKKIRTKFKGRFYGKFALGDSSIEKLYRKKKEKSLMDAEKNPMTGQQVKFKEQRDLLLYILRKNLKLSYRQMEEMLTEYDFAMTYVMIRGICAKFGDRDTEIDKKDIKTIKIQEKSEINDENPEIEPINEEISEKTAEIEEKIEENDNNVN
jgi:hypothetical protein